MNKRKIVAHCRPSLVGVPGLEPGTSSLSGTRSNQLSYTPENVVEAEGTRTADILLAKQVLYQLSYAPLPLKRAWASYPEPDLPLGQWWRHAERAVEEGVLTAEKYDIQLDVVADTHTQRLLFGA